MALTYITGEADASAVASADWWGRLCLRCNKDETLIWRSQSIMRPRRASYCSGNGSLSRDNEHDTIKRAGGRCHKWAIHKQK